MLDSQTLKASVFILYLATGDRNSVCNL